MPYLSRLYWLKAGLKLFFWNLESPVLSTNCCFGDMYLKTQLFRLRPEYLAEGWRHPGDGRAVRTQRWRSPGGPGGCRTGCPASVPTRLGGQATQRDMQPRFGALIRAACGFASLFTYTYTSGCGKPLKKFKYRSECKGRRCWLGVVLEWCTNQLAARMIWRKRFVRTSILEGWWFCMVWTGWSLPSLLYLSFFYAKNPLLYSTTEARSQPQWANRSKNKQNRTKKIPQRTMFVP